MSRDKLKILSKHLFIPINYSIRSIYLVYTFARICLSVICRLFFYFLNGLFWG